MRKISSSPETGGDCPNCGKKGGLSLPSKVGMAACGSCNGWAYLAPLSIQPESLYSEEYFNGTEYSSYGKSEPTYKLNFHRKIRALRSAGVLGTKSTPIFELGCATGIFLDCLREEGYTNLLAGEISPYATCLARKKGHEVISPLSANFLSRIENFAPKLLCAWDVWEHLPSPASVFSELLGVSAPETALALTTLDASALVPRIRQTKWRQFHPPTHLNYPTRRSFELFFAAQGLIPKTQVSWGSYRPAADYLIALGNPMSKLAKLPLAYHFPIYLNTGDTQLVVGKRSAKTIAK